MKLSREISAIAIPAIVTNITTPLLSLADTAISGHIGEAAYLGAVAVGGTLFNTLYWLFNFLRMGTTGFTAQAYGAGKPTSTELWRSAAVALSLGVLLIAIAHPLGRTVLTLMDADADTLPLAVRYFNIVIWGAPAVLGTYSAMGWLVGMQNTRTTMVAAIATNVINIAVSCTLVFALGWKIEGVATGTLVAQWSGYIIVSALIAYKYRPALPDSFKDLAGGRLLRFFSVNTDIFFRTACLVAVTLWFTHSGAKSGVDILAANALLLQLFMLFSFFMDGFAYAAEALSGKYHGSTDHAGLHRLVKALCRTGLVCALAFTALYGLAGINIISLLTDRPEILAVARHYLPWAVAIPLCSYLAFIYDGILIGLTRTRLMLGAMAAAMAVFFVLHTSLHTTLANHGLWLAFDAYLLTRGIVEATCSKQ